MAEVTLKVPGDYVEGFRRAVVLEIAHDSGWVKTCATELGGGLEGEDCESAQLADLRASSSSLKECLGIVEQVFGVEAGALEVRGSAETLGHILECMAREVVQPKLASEVGFGPIPTVAARQLTKALDWALQQAGGLREQADGEWVAAKEKAERETVAV
jgi:hypothetical protein